MNFHLLFGISGTFVFLLEASYSSAFTFPSVYTSFGPLRLRDASLRNTDTDTNDAAFSAFAETLQEEELFTDEESGGSSETNTWQESLEAFLDPTTPPGKKQVLLSDLVSANEEIRTSVESAIRERKVRRKQERDRPFKGRTFASVLSLCSLD